MSSISCSLIICFLLLEPGSCRHEEICYNCGDDDPRTIDEAVREAKAEVLPFRSHFSEDNAVVLNYSVAALAAIKVSQKTGYLDGKLPRRMCPLKKYMCSFGKYRHTDGRCTNLFSPLSGSAYSPFSRRIKANYDDDLSAPRSHGYRNRPLPHPEVVEKQIARIPAVFPIPLTSTFLEFSEFLYTDLAKFIKLQESLGCCGSSNRECLNVGTHMLDCYIRSAPSPLPHCSYGKREQMNLATSFIDAGPIYQNLKDISKGARLSTFSLEKSSIHNLLVEEHNWVVDQLQKTFPSMPSEILFEEARKFVIAELQHITFEHFLPILIGEETMDKYDLRAAHCDGGSCHEIEANTLNEYGSAAGLFHKFMTTSDKGSSTSSSSSSSSSPTTIFNPSLYTSEFSTTTSKPELSDILLKGRDHGLGTYAQWRKECGGGEIKSYKQLIGLVDDQILKSVRDLFPEIKDVDLIILGITESPVYGSLVGPTFGCILALQFQKAKFGDSYWYTKKLLKEQIEEVEKSSISALMCRHQKATQIQKDGFRSPDDFTNIPIACNSSAFPQINFSKWIPKDDVIQKPKDSKFDDVLGECIQEVSEARSRQKGPSFQEGNLHSVALKSYGSMMLAKDEAVNEANVSFILLEATRKLVKLKNVDLESIQGVYIGEDFGKKSDENCNPKDFPCDPTNPYRTYTGWCNNLENPSSANTFRELVRLLPPAYEDGINTPRAKTTSRNRLPSPRAISNAVHHAKKIEHIKYSHFLMEFGQFIDHDITHSPVDQNPDGTPLNCSRCDSHLHVSPSCFPIPVPANDQHFEPFSCLSFVRSLPAQKTLGYRNQMNQVSAYLDGSAMYGSTKCEGDRLRTFEDGKMKTTQISRRKRHYGITLSQSDESEQDGCVSSPEHPCFIAGDDRNSQQTLLIAVHSVFHREHERIATILKEINGHWNDERIYQEARKLISAEFAHVVYNEYLPIVVGQKMMDQYELRPLAEGYFTGYQTCDASILQPFATAAFRFGHSTVTRFTPMQETVFSPATRVVDLASDFINMSKIYNNDAVEQILGGMHGKHQMMTDRFVDDAVRNFLFSDRGKRGTGLDLIAINIQRGRDHGIPPYNHYRTFCGLDRLTSFYSIFSDIDQDGLAAIAQVYESPDDIDLFTGVVSEKTIPGALVGPTAACIISEQFRRLKKCDRFYYENGKEHSKFAEEQLKEIRKISMSSLICANTKVPKIAKDVFSVPEPFLNPLIDCTLSPRIDLSKWREAKDCIYKNKYIPLHTTMSISPCSKCTCTSDGVKCAFLSPDCLAHTKELLAEDPICFMQCAHHLRDNY
ncbi:unnamed protein product [Caenorhabditis sp. 36 PRJEB53466]|nr:unnamed protein product [Caenorhabditis sp. 36 PRJEB53466]